jgi:hypothetical protein
MKKFSKFISENRDIGKNLDLISGIEESMDGEERIYSVMEDGELKLESDDDGMTLAERFPTLFG